MRPIGFSTGAVALSDVRRAIELLKSIPVDAIELSAIRVHEWEPLLNIVGELDLKRYRHISLHAPSRFGPEQEAWIFQTLYDQRDCNWPVIVHPDTLYDLSSWKLLGKRLCLENMDQRKPIGRSVRELEFCFSQVPDATFCFDIGHARQVDPSMTEAHLMLKRFGERLIQIHVSEVNSSSEHRPLSYISILDFQEVAARIPAHVPVIIESIVRPDQIAPEIERVRRALAGKAHRAA